MQFSKTISYKQGLIWVKEFQGGTPEVYYQTSSKSWMRKAKTISAAKGLITKASKRG